MGMILTEEWLLAQNRVLGAALLDSNLVPRVVTELTPEDFTGNSRAIYDAMVKCFRVSSSAKSVDPIAISHEMGDSNATRTLLAQYMDLAPLASEFDHFLSLAKDQSKLNRLHDLGHALSQTSTLSDALEKANLISNQLVDRPSLRMYSPDTLLEQFALRHSKSQKFAEWRIREVNDYVKVKPGKFFVIAAEPSGGKTAFALDQLWSLSADKRVLFCSLETDEGTLFDRLLSNLADIPMSALESGNITPDQFQRVQEISDLICQRNFQILPCAGLSVPGIKASAISAKADIVIIDYLQLIQSSSKNQSRYETVTEISMDLHILAQSTGLTVIALSQVTNRDPSAKRSPLGMHSVRESGQIEADADAMLMIDRFVEKSLRESGCRANRVLRIVKNKNGRCCNIPLYFDGRTQKFSKVYIPDPDWEKAKKSKSQTDPPPENTFEQIAMTDDVPF